MLLIQRLRVRNVGTHVVAALVGLLRVAGALLVCRDSVWVVISGATVGHLDHQQSISKSADGRPSSTRAPLKQARDVPGRLESLARIRKPALYRALYPQDATRPETNTRLKQSRPYTAKRRPRPPGEPPGLGRQRV